MNRDENRLPVLNSIIIILHYAIGYTFLYPRLISYLYGKGFIVRGTNIAEIAVYLFVLVTTVLLSWPFIRYGWKKYVEKFPQNTKLIGMMQLAMMGCVLMMGAAIYLLTDMETSFNQQVIDEARKINLPYVAFASVVFAPLVEEMVFRGSIYNLLNRYLKKGTAMFITSLLFGLLHVFDGALANNYVEVVFVFMYGALGYMLNYTYAKTDSIVCSVLLHMLNNALSLLR